MEWYRTDYVVCGVVCGGYYVAGGWGGGWRGVGNLVLSSTVMSGLGISARSDLAKPRQRDHFCDHNSLQALWLLSVHQDNSKFKI